MQLDPNNESVKENIRVCYIVFSLVCLLSVLLNHYDVINLPQVAEQKLIEEQQHPNRSQVLSIFQSLHLSAALTIFQLGTTF